MCSRPQVIDVETEETLGPGQDGEICVKGPTVMKGINPAVMHLSMLSPRVGGGGGRPRGI